MNFFPRSQRVPTGIWIALIIAANILLMTGLVVTSNAQTTAVQATGVFSVTYADHAETPFVRYTLTLANETVLTLAIRPEQLIPLGGIAQAPGQRVRVTFDPALSADDVRDADYTTTLPVAALESLGDSGGGGGLVDPQAIGSHNWLNLLCKFSDVSTTQLTTADINTRMRATYPGVRHLYSELSLGQLTIGSVKTTAWRTLSRTLAQYTTGGVTNLDLMFTDCVGIHAAHENFNSYFGFNMFFNAEFGGFAFGTSCKSATINGVNKCWRATWIPATFSFATTHLIAHEMGHAYGLPHTNNSDEDTNPYDGSFDLMSAYVFRAYDSTFGWIPQHMSAYSKSLLGYFGGTRTFNAPAGASTITIDRTAMPNSTNYYTAIIPISGSRWFTVEARRQGFGDYDENIFASGIVIHEVNTGRTEPAWQVNAISDGASLVGPGVFQPGETYRSYANNFSVQVNNATANGYNVTIQRGTLSGSAPSLNVVPSLVSAPAGKGIYNLTVTNNGGTATGVTLALDPVTTYGFAEITGADCAAPDANNTRYQRMILCSIGTLATGEQRLLSLDVRPLVAGNVTLRLPVIANEVGSMPGTTVATLTSTLTTLPDISLTMTPDRDILAIGERVEYAVRVRNMGGATASNVSMTVQLPPGLRLVSGNTSWNGTISTPNCTFDVPNQRANCTAASMGSYLANGTQLVFLLRADAETNGTKTVTATATNSSGDSTPTNNSSSVTTIVGAPASLTITAALQGRPPAPSSQRVEPIDVILQPTGTTGVRIETTAMTDTNGRITITDIVPATYTLWVKGEHSLGVTQAVTLAGGANSVTTTTLREGDANGDNAITLADFTILASMFGQTSSSPTFDPRADFNRDNAVTLADFTLMADNFGDNGIAAP